MNLYLNKKILTLLTGSCLILSQGVCFSNPDSLAEQISKDFTAVAKNAIPAVVSIKVTSPNTSMFDSSDDHNNPLGDDFFQFFFSPRQGWKQPQQHGVTGQASGFIVSPDGYILTNSHVVHNATTINVFLNDGREFKGKVIGQDPSTDIALVKIDANNLPYLKLGDSDKLEIGQWAIAIGNMFGLQASLTVGVVSAKGRNNLDLAEREDFIQTDAAINRGNSGGPLLSLDGKVYGMNTAIVTDGGSGYTGIGFSIPSNMLKHVLDQLIKTGSVTRGFIGVTLQNIDPDLAQAFGLKQAGGALIADVSRGSPAEKAGLKQGDIIQAYNNLPVSNISSLRNAIALMTPGDRISLKVLRNGSAIDIPVQIGNYPTSNPQPAALGSGNQLGFEIQDLTPELAHSLGITENSGVVINKIANGSIAALTGLKKGTVILAINQKKVSSVSQFNEALSETPANKPVLLLVKVGDSIRFISLKVGG